MGRLFAGAFIISFAPILVKASTLSPTLIGFYRCIFAASIQLGLLACVPSLRPSGKMMRDRRVWLACAGAGIFFAMDLFVWHRSVVYAGAGLGTILANTQVFYVAVLGVLLYGERATPRFLISVPMAFIGVYLLAVHRMDIAPGAHYKLGVICGLLTGVMYTLFLVFLRKAEKVLGRNGTLWNLAWMSTGASVCLGLLALVEGDIIVPGGWDIVWLFLLGAGPQTIGWLLITRGLSEIPLSKAGLGLLIQPALATVLGAWIFKERLDALQSFGALLTLGGIYLGTTRAAS